MEIIEIKKINFDDWPNYNPFSIQDVREEAYTNLNKIKRNAESYILIYIISGNMEISISDHTFKAESASVVLIPKNNMYTLTSSGNLHIYQTTFCGNLIDDLMKSLQLSGLVYSNCDISQIFKELLNYNRESSLSTQTAYPFGKICEMLYFIYRHDYRPTIINKEPKIGTSDYTRIAIDRHLDTFYSNEALAELQGVSVSTLTRQFKKKYKITPMEYQSRVKINEIKRLIEEDKLSMKQIAYSLNFCDSSYLTSYFKRLTGFTPLQYKKTLKKP